jgi:hypothetical protein
MRKLLFILTGLLILTTSCNDDVVTDSQILQYIPENSSILLSTDDLSALRQFTKSSKLYKQVKNLERVQEISSASAFLNDHKLRDQSIISLSIEGKNKIVVSLVAPASEQIYIGDSLQSTNEIIAYNGNKIKSTSTGTYTYYSTTHNGFYLASSSQIVIESLVRRELKDYVFDKSFETIYSRTGITSTSIYVNASQENWLEQFLLNNNPEKKDNYAEWFQLELINTNEYALELDGLLTYRDSTKQSQRFYNKLNAVANKIQFIAPITARYIKSTSYGNPEQLIENLKVNDVRISGTLQEIITNSSELSEIGAAGDRAVVFTLLPYESFFMDLESAASAKTTYRDYTIFKLKNPINGGQLKPMITGQSLPYISLVNDYLLLGPNAASLENIIANYESQAVYAKQGWWDGVMKNMSDASSLLYILSNTYVKDKTAGGSTADKALVKKIESTTYPAIISQYAHEDEYAHYHLIVPKATKSETQLVTSQLGAYKSAAAVIAGPFLFPNHNTSHHDVAFQDASGELVLLADDGTKLWSKKIDGTIMGDIKAVDGLKNSKFQLVFNTEKALYYLDRDGNAMDGFPVKFKDAVTQPVSTFDYDNKRDYRLVVTQGKNLLIYNVTGKKVSGFNYASSVAIITQPLHVKVGSDDYIAFAKADNTIAILNRTGGVRTKVKGQVAVDGDLYFHKNNLSAKTTDGALVSISLGSGTVTNNGAVPSDALYAASGTMEITTTNNKVTLNGQNVSIPFGTFENLRVTQLNNIPYAHFIESGEKKAYIVSKNANVVESMPVYGTAKTAIAISKFKYLVTLDGNDVIIYRW